MDYLGVIVKVLVLSAGVSVAIKYLAPFLAIPATDTNALIGVLLPTIVMGLILGWRSTFKPQDDG